MMKKIIITFGLTLASIFGHTWEYHELKDEMTDQIVRKRVIQRSDNKIEGWIQNDPLSLIVNCQAIIWINGRPFGGFDYDTTIYSNIKVHRHRIRFDSDKPEIVDWYVTENIDHAILRRSARITVDGEFISFNEFFRQKLQSSDTLLIEVKPFNTHRTEIATFDLTGFGEAYASCPN